MELSRLVPQDFTDVRELLEFAIDMREGGFRSDGADQMILRNILESLYDVNNAARNAGMEETRRTLSEAIGIPRAHCAMHWGAAGLIADCLLDFLRQLAGLASGAKATCPASSAAWPRFPLRFRHSARDNAVHRPTTVEDRRKRCNLLTV